MLSQLNSNTAAGPDDIPAFLLKNLAEALAANLADIFNASIRTGCFPDMWKEANMCAVWKGKGCKKDPSSYRSISVHPVLASVLEKVVAAQLKNDCNRNAIMPNQQVGFRKGFSCELAVLRALESWYSSLDKGNVVGALLVDLSRAFDTVPYQKLISKVWLLDVVGRP